jgi:hypothetical protein
MAYQEQYPPPEPRPDPRYLQPHNQSSQGSMPDLEPMRSRNNSTAQDGYTSDSSRYSKARAPINEAINSAFTNSSATANAMSPDILQQLTAQITANVIQQLKVSNISVPGVSPVIPPAAPSDYKSSNGGSPPIDRASVYTPPSPFGPGEPQKSPGRGGLGVDMLNGSGPYLATDRQASPPLSQSSQPGDEKNFRPKGPQRISTGGDMTVVEKIWGTLFDQSGEATPRLGQFLRGIAMHLISDYEPKDSLVVTPRKMQRYYEETKLDHEPYPWKDIFDDRTSSISRMFRELEVQHHLVQEKASERPDIPGLTPRGFEAWFILLIKAHPDQEYERLAKTALDMPISNPDNRSERFPKELSRRLFPGRGDADIETKMCKSMSVHCNLNLPSRHGSTATTEQAESELRASNVGLGSKSGGVPPTPRDSQPSTDQGPAGRPHSISSASASGAAVVSEGEDTPTPQPIERERKPYAAQPGGGKEYNNIPPPASATEARPPEQAASSLRRTASNRESRPRPDDINKPRPAPISVHQTSGSSAANSAPLEIPESRHRHRNSTYYRDNPPGGGAPRRTRSPSASKDTRPSVRYSEPRFEQHTAAGSAPTEFERDRDSRYRDYELQRERLAGDRYDAARMAAYDPRDREKERADTRPRGQSVASYGHGDDEYYRGVGGYPPPDRARDRDAIPPVGVYGSSAPPFSTPSGGPHYPPSSYREGR